MTSLVLVTASDSRPARLAEFRDAAGRLAAAWHTPAITRVDTGDDICRAIERYDEIERLAICCHGWPDRLVARGRGVRVGVQRPPGTISVSYLASVLTPRVGPGLRVAVAACSAAADPGLGRWMPGGSSYGPGGSESLCAHLWRELQAPTQGRVVVAGHSTPGHTTRNPAIRVWGPGWGPGASALDHYLGDGAHRDRRQRASWLDRCALPALTAGLCVAESILAGVP